MKTEGLIIIGKGGSGKTFFTFSFLCYCYFKSIPITWIDNGNYPDLTRWSELSHLNIPKSDKLKIIDWNGDIAELTKSPWYDSSQVVLIAESSATSIDIFNSLSKIDIEPIVVQNLFWTKRSRAAWHRSSIRSNFLDKKGIELSLPSLDRYTWQGLVDEPSKFVDLDQEISLDLKINSQKLSQIKNITLTDSQKDLALASVQARLFKEFHQKFAAQMKVFDEILFSGG